jgi:hypothetical protein
MTIAPAPLDGELLDVLTLDEAQAVTTEIRTWVRSYPAAAVAKAFYGQVWLALGYESWDEYCDSELGGFKLPAPQRQEAVAALAAAGMSNRAIADAVNADEKTVRNDRAATAENSAVDRKTTGKDGKQRAAAKKKQPTPKKNEPKPEPEDNADSADEPVDDDKPTMTREEAEGLTDRIADAAGDASAKLAALHEKATGALVNLNEGVGLIWQAVMVMTELRPVIAISDDADNAARKLVSDARDMLQLAANDLTDQLGDGDDLTFTDGEKMSDFPSLMPDTIGGTVEVAERAAEHGAAG